VARQLLQLDAALAPGALMRDVKFNGLPIATETLATWTDSIPVNGVLECNFAPTRECRSVAVLDWKKVAAIETEFRSPCVTDAAKLDLVSTLAPYNYLYAWQIARILRCIGTGDALVEAACLLFARCADLEDGYADILAALSKRDAYFVKKRLGMYAMFRGSNPTGHYHLDLSVLRERLLAVRLKDEALSEGAEVTWLNTTCALGNFTNTIWLLLSASRSKLDCTEMHVYIVRCEVFTCSRGYTRAVAARARGVRRYEKSGLVQKFIPHAGPPKDWGGAVQNYGSLSFDFVSARVPPKTAPIATQDEVMAALGRCGIHVKDGAPASSQGKSSAARPCPSSMESACLR
jgi:hypothetical protein